VTKGLAFHGMCTCRILDIGQGKCEHVREGHLGPLNTVCLGHENAALIVSDD